MGVTPERRKIVAAANAAARASDRLASDMAAGVKDHRKAATRLIAAITRLEGVCTMIELINEPVE